MALRRDLSSPTGVGAALELPFISVHVLLCGPWGRSLGEGSCSKPLYVEAPEQLRGGWWGTQLLILRAREAFRGCDLASLFKVPLFLVENGF